jgi:hypothetical protein
VAGRGDAGVAGFGFVVPPLAGSSAIVLVDGAAGPGTELARIGLGSPGAGPPLKLDLAVMPPAARSPEHRTVMWQVGGGNGTPARVTLRFSRDGGATWQVLLAGSRDTRFELDLAQLGGSTGGLVEVTATAGAASIARRASLGALANRPPRVGILGEDVIRRSAGEPLVLAGEAFDLEDGAIADANLVWTLMPRGHTSTGRTMVLPQGLPDGLYTVLLTAVDSTGAAQGARATVLVGRNAGAFLPWVGTRR